MIDLLPSLRTFLLNDVNLSSYPVYTRVPVPENAPYPHIIISPIVSAPDNNFIRCKRRPITHDIYVYGNNDSSTNYREVERIALIIANKFDTFNRHFIDLPVGVNLIDVTVRGPLTAPVDDLTKVGRAVLIELDINF